MSGIFGVVSQENCMDDLFYGTDYHSHLGEEFGGLAVYNKEIHREIHRIEHGQFKNIFDNFYRTQSGHQGIGVISDSDPQPIVVGSRFGNFTIVTSGLITNHRELAQRLMDEGVTFGEIGHPDTNQTELVAKLIAKRQDIVSGIESALESIRGSVSILLLTAEGLYAARDLHGRFPLAVGEKGGSYAVSCETCAFPNLGYRVVKYLQPGEIVFIDTSGLKNVRTSNTRLKICAFLWIYTGFPASMYENISVESARERCGAALAKKDMVKADLVSGVPDSGTGHAIGYAMESKLPFRRPLVKYSAGYGRSYIPRSQQVRDRVATMKLIPIKDITKGNRLIVCEDSIVRGTQLRNLTIQKLWNAGAREVHIRVACPPLLFPCKYNLSTRSIEELAARRAIEALEGQQVDDVSEYLDEKSEKYAAMVEWIRNDLRCTSLLYLSIHEMVQAIGIPQEELCTYCWTGVEEE